MNFFFTIGALLTALIFSNGSALAQGGVGSPSVTSGPAMQPANGFGNSPANRSPAYGDTAKTGSSMMALLSLPPEIRSLVLPRALLLQLTSQIALEKASDAEVKVYAQTILDERSPFSQQLQPFHSTSDVQTVIYKDVPGFISTIKRLTLAKAGKDFDKQYTGSQMEIMEELRIDLDAYLAQPVLPRQNPQSRLWANSFNAAMTAPAASAHDIYKRLIKPDPVVEPKPSAGNIAPIGTRR